MDGKWCCKPLVAGSNPVTGSIVLKVKLMKVISSDSVRITPLARFTQPTVVDSMYNPLLTEKAFLNWDRAVGLIGKPTKPKMIQPFPLGRDWKFRIQYHNRLYLGTFKTKEIFLIPPVRFLPSNYERDQEGVLRAGHLPLLEGVRLE